MGEPVPEHLRHNIRAELDALVRGERPEAMLWVHRYGGRGATLIRQPDDIWEHRYTHVDDLPDGRWEVVLPLWTTEESPSDLSVEMHVDADGNARIYDLHVL